MFKKLHDVSIIWKYIIIYFLICIVPISVLVFYIYNISQKNVFDNAQSYLRQTLVQTNKNISNNIYTIRKISQEIANDKIIKDFLDMPYEGTGEDILNYRNKIFPYLRLRKSLISHAYSIWIFKSSPDIPTSWDSGVGIEDISRFSLTDSTQKPENRDFWWEENHLDILSRGTPKAAEKQRVYSYNYIIRSPGRNKISGVLNIQTKVEELFKDISLYNSPRTGDMYIVDKKGEIMYTPHKQDTEKNIFDLYPEQKLSLDFFQNSGEWRSKDYIFSSIGVEELNCWLLSVLPIKNIDKDIAQSKRGILFDMIIIFILVLLGIAIATFGITKKIRRLAEAVEQVHDGNYDVSVIQGGNDEFGKLNASFNEMTKKIRTLITEVYEAEIKVKDASLRMLEAQVNPHFLYNTLTSIASVAKKNRDDEAQKMAISLGKFYRIGLSKKSETITIAEECEYLQMYLNLQMVRYNNRFLCRFNIPEELRQYRIIRNLLQPMVENALLHGLENREKDGLIDIRLEQTGNKLIFTVSDNGNGMPEEKLEDINNGRFELGSSSGYGLKNVNDRLKIFYGSSSSLRIESSVESGTSVKIEIPITSEQGERKS